MKQDIQFKTVKYGSSDYNKAVVLGEKILRRPLGLSFTAEELEKDEEHMHIVGIINDEVVAALLLVPEEKICRMQRVAVREDLQDKGIGTQLLKFCEAQAAKLGFKEIYCHARDSAVSFYLKNGWITEGSYFEQSTIPHIKMRKVL